MKNYLSILTAVALLAMFSCQSPKQQSENYQSEVADNLAHQMKLYLEAWANEDLDSCMTFLADDFINMFSFGPAADLDQCRESFKNVFANYSIEDVEYKRVECIVHYDMAFEVGLFKQKWISNNKQDTISFDMRGMSVFRKQEDCSWKQFRLMAQQ